MISPWVVFDGSTSVPAMAPFSSCVAQLVDLLLLHQCRAHHSTDDPNTWPSSRPSLAAHGRDYGLPLLDHLRNMGSPPKLQRQLENHGLLLATICDPLSVPSLRIADGSIVTFLSFYVLSFLLSSSTSESDGQLGSPRRVHRCGILCSPVFSLCSSPCISPPVSVP